jgi:hypothetical protein
MDCIPNLPEEDLMTVENNAQGKGPLPCLELADRMIDDAVENPVARKIAKDTVRQQPSVVAYGNPVARAGLGVLTEGASEVVYQVADAFCESALNDWEKMKTGKTN